MQGTLKTTPGKNHSQPAARPAVMTAPPISTVNRVHIQNRARISSPDDPQEKEADNTAQKIMRMSVPAQTVSAGAKNVLMRSAARISQNQQERETLISPYIALSLIHI